jgi:hypothetical protein
MVLDEDLLAKAKTTAAELVGAERKVQLARAEHHTVVRRLHLAGGSFREIGQALGLSHQRVQQIVEGAGGTWWQRVWRTRNPKPDTVCSFCEKPPSEVAKLLAGPKVHICDACVTSAETTSRGRPSAGFGAPTASAACAFCGKRKSDDRRLVGHRAGSVCTACLLVSRQIIEDRAPSD